MTLEKSKLGSHTKSKGSQTGNENVNNNYYYDISVALFTNRRGALTEPVTVFSTE